MEKKKTWLWVLIGLIVVALVGVGVFFFLNKDSKKDSKKEDTKKEEKVEDKEKATPLLYKVTKDGSDTEIYLFGSIHLADDRAYPMRDEILNAYNKSDNLAVEFDIVEYAKNTQQQMEDAKLLIYTDGTQISDHLSKESYDTIMQYIKNNNAYNSVYEMYKPVLFFTLMEQIQAVKSGLQQDKGIDLYFLNKAHEENKNIIDIESSSFQYGFLSGFSDRFYEYLILAGIVGEEESVNGLKNLYESWLKGDSAGIESSNSDEIDDSAKFLDKDLLEEAKRFNEGFIYERNENMAKAVDGFYKEGKNTFVVVGVAHIVGDRGVAKLLEKEGYKVELVEYK